MARTEITKIATPTKYDIDGTAITWTSLSDDGDGYYATFAGSLWVACKNGGASTATITIDSVADPQYQRTGDKTVTLAAGEERVFLVPETGFSQDGGKCLINVSGTGADDVDVYVTAINI